MNEVFKKWCTEIWPPQKAAGILRAGQSYMIYVRPRDSCPRLFYEKDELEAWKMIMHVESTGNFPE